MKFFGGRKMRIVLASKSPRRRELLSLLYSDFEIEVADCDESLPDDTPVERGVEILALRKGRAVLPKCADALVISSDTLVELDGVALGKPSDDCDAFRMLKSLSARINYVHTGVAVHYRGRVASGVATTAVKFRELSDEEIWEYVKTGEPRDKAGAYGIQSGAGHFVESIDGDFDTVVGLSTRLLKRLIDEVSDK